MDRTERFYKIDQLLNDRTVVSIATLLEELGVSLATLKRDLNYMSERLHAPIRWDRKNSGYRYQLHSTLCRAFSTPDNKCPEGEFLWRLEPEADPAGCPRILVQSKAMPNWAGVGVQGWLANADPAIDLQDRLTLDLLKAGQRFRFRLRANPCVKHDGKRLGLLRTNEQEAWLERKGKQHGFSIPKLASFDFSEAPQARIDVRISQEQMLRGKQHTGNGIRVYSVLYDGVLMVAEPDNFRDALQTGIGHGKAMGLGLLSVVPTA